MDLGSQDSMDLDSQDSMDLGDSEVEQGQFINLYKLEVMSIGRCKKKIFDINSCDCTNMYTVFSSK